MAANNPPFATADGKPIAPSGGSSGAHDFVTDPKSGSSAPKGRDFTKESRTQAADARPEVAPNPQSIPPGGKILKADPTPVSARVSGTAAGPQPPKPFKLKG